MPFIKRPGDLGKACPRGKPHRGSRSGGYGRTRGRRRRETGLTGWPGLSAAQARAAGGAERPCGLGRCEAGRGAGVAWAVKAGPGAVEGFGPCAG